MDEAEYILYECGLKAKVRDEIREHIESVREENWETDRLTSSHICYVPLNNGTMVAGSIYVDAAVESALDGLMDHVEEAVRLENREHYLRLRCEAEQISRDFLRDLFF